MFASLKLGMEPTDAFDAPLDFAKYLTKSIHSFKDQKQTKLPGSPALGSIMTLEIAAEDAQIVEQKDTGVEELEKMDIITITISVVILGLYFRKPLYMIIPVLNLGLKFEFLFFQNCSTFFLQFVSSFFNGYFNGFPLSNWKIDHACCICCPFFNVFHLNCNFF